MSNVVPSLVQSNWAGIEDVEEILQTLVAQWGHIRDLLPQRLQL